MPICIIMCDAFVSSVFWVVVIIGGLAALEIAWNIWISTGILMQVW